MRRADFSRTQPGEQEQLLELCGGAETFGFNGQRLGGKDKAALGIANRQSLWQVR